MTVPEQVRAHITHEFAVKQHPSVPAVTELPKFPFVSGTTCPIVRPVMNNALNTSSNLTKEYLQVSSKH